MENQANNYYISRKAKLLKNFGKTANNRAYLASCFRHFTQIPHQETSDTLGMLYTIMLGG